MGLWQWLDGDTYARLLSLSEYYCNVGEIFPQKVITVDIK
jgi:hypothetical protein